jgi:hypothetical protein
MFELVNMPHFLGSGLPGKNNIERFNKERGIDSSAESIAASASRNKIALLVTSAMCLWDNMFNRSHIGMIVVFVRQQYG